MIKATFDYRVCSLAYAECKIRNIDRNDSYVNQFLDPMVELRYSDHIYPLFIIRYIILYYSIIKYLRDYILKV